MKPTPTPEMIEAHAIADAKFAGMDFATLGRADKKRFLERAASCLSAALVVGEPSDAHREAIDHINRLIVALKPFVEFSQNVEFDADLNTVVWASRIHRDPLSTWFGPSDFAYARFAVGDTTERLPHIAAPSAPDGWQDAIRLVIEYDNLLRHWEGPEQVLLAGDVEEIDAAYDKMISACRAAFEEVSR